MNSDLVRLAVILAVVAGLLYFKQYSESNNQVKNEGTLSVGDNESAGNAVGAGMDADREENPQIETVSENESYMQRVKNDQLYKNNCNVLPNPQMSNANAPQGNFRPAQLSNFAQLDCFPKDQLSAKDLIPREDAYNVWNQSNPPVQGALSNKNFVDSGHHFGLNTVGQSLKNANLQLRSDPLIPQRQVGPWMQSTIEADTNRRPFEIGGC